MIKAPSLSIIVKLSLTAAVLVLPLSCKLIPEIEGTYPVAKIPEPGGQEGALFNRTGQGGQSERRSSSGPETGEEHKTAEAGTAGPPPEGKDTGEGAVPTGDAVINLPEEEPAEREPPLPLGPSLELAEADYPGQPPEEASPAGTAPRTETPPPLPQTPVTAPPLATTPPAASTQPAPRQETPRTPPQTAPVTPPPPVTAPPPPVTARPSQPVPPPRQERETAVPDMPFQPVSPAPAETAEKDLAYSRTVRALSGQYVEIPFRGPGWVYLGEFGSRRGVSYDSRRMEEEGMTFVFRADTPGTYSLKFNRQDFVRDIILNDYVKVIVEAPPRSGSSWLQSRPDPDRVYALPRWPEAAFPVGTAGTARPADARPAVQTAPGTGASSSGGQSGGAAATAAETAPPPAQTASVPGEISVGTTVPTVTEPATASSIVAAPAAAGGTADKAAAVQTEDWLKKAREEYTAGRIAGALGALDQYMARFPAGSDEAFWLYGQSLEANNEATRNIRQAMDYYRRLVRDYPLSSRYDDARKRIAYLERFYFTIQ